MTERLSKRAAGLSPASVKPDPLRAIRALSCAARDAGTGPWPARPRLSARCAEVRIGTSTTGAHSRREDRTLTVRD
jgi:hypothetical protein